jgi:hypothetical protein
MKYLFTLLFSILSFFANAQNVSSDTLSAESLENSFNAINKRLYEKLLPETKVTRGASSGPCASCRPDLQNLLNLIDNAIVAQKKCHFGQGNINELTRIFFRIKDISENKQCRWDDCPEMYLVLFIKYAEFEDIAKRYPCAK